MSSDEWYLKHRNERIAAAKLYQDNHKKEHNENSKRYVRKNPVRRRKTKREYMRRLRLRVLHHYSNGLMSCAYCGITDLRVLSIDHVASDGAEHRKINKGNLYEWILSHKFPKGLQVLCMNCQFIKRHTRQEYRKTRTIEGPLANFTKEETK